MGVEIDGRLGHNDYRLRKLTQQLKEKDKEIDALRESLEEALKKFVFEMVIFFFLWH